MIDGLSFKLYATPATMNKISGQKGQRELTDFLQ
jgi:hypothetical protein